jgi:hypothetical protein
MSAIPPFYHTFQKPGCVWEYYLHDFCHISAKKPSGNALGPQKLKTPSLTPDNLKFTSMAHD